jgi:hypothetical protein
MKVPGFVRGGPLVVADLHTDETLLDLHSCSRLENASIWTGHSGSFGEHRQPGPARPHRLQDVGARERIGSVAIRCGRR